MTKDLAERLESGLASAWRPDKDDESVLIGKVTTVEVGESEYGRYPIVVVEQDSGEEKAVHAFHTVLQNELIRQKPQPGERIGIKFLGEQPTKPGSKYKSFIGYTVKVERDTAGGFNWNSVIAGEPDPEPAGTPDPPRPAVVVPDGADTEDDGIPF